MMRTLGGLMVLAAGLLTFGCIPSGGGDGSCDEGDLAACICADGTEGRKVCDAEGDYGDCGQCGIGAGGQGGEGGPGGASGAGGELGGDCAGFCAQRLTCSGDNDGCEAECAGFPAACVSCVVASTCDALQQGDCFDLCFPDVGAGGEGPGGMGGDAAGGMGGEGPGGAGGEGPGGMGGEGPGGMGGGGPGGAGGGPAGGPMCADDGDCDAACGWVEQCVVDYCGGDLSPDFDGFAQACEMQCAGFAPLICGFEACEQTYMFFGGAPDDLCGEGGGGGENDPCAEARVVDLDEGFAEINLSNVGVTNNLGGSCINGSADSVVVQLQGNGSVVSLELNPATYDTVMSVRFGDCENGEEVACDDDGGPGTASAIGELPLPAGLDVFVIVSGYSSGDQGEATLRITPLE